jgi:hypothetical protein
LPELRLTRVYHADVSTVAAEAEVALMATTTPAARTVAASAAPRAFIADVLLTS